MTHVLSEKKVPRGQGRTLIKHSIRGTDVSMLEREGLWDWFVENVCEPVADFVVEVVVEPVSQAIDVVVEAVAPIWDAAVEAFNTVCGAIRDALMWLTNAAFEAAIGCRPVEKVEAVLSAAGAAIVSGIKDYIETEILHRLDELRGLEREERKEANTQWINEIHEYREKLAQIFGESFAAKAEVLHQKFQDCMSGAGAKYDKDG